MACACGFQHTITLADDGTAHAFGRNDDGQLGLGNNNQVSLPTPIPNLPQISLISCGNSFTVCVDCDGFMWSFGDNKCGQLGTGNTTNFNVPQKIQDIPPVLSVNCGLYHTLIITTDSNLWSCGNNCNRQLCLGANIENQLKPHKTSFSNISKVSAGWYHSLFQNDQGEIFACGSNGYGECGLGYTNYSQTKPSLIPNTPSNIVHFVCGNGISILLDAEGNVYSFGKNEQGSLGLGHNANQNVLSKISNIPPIKIISCANVSCYLIDFEGNLWSFGLNDFGQLGQGNKLNLNVPKVISTLKNIQQISYGCTGRHFIAKNSQNQIFVAGSNDFVQLGTGETQPLPSRKLVPRNGNINTVSTPKEINSQYSNIWRDEFYSRAKSARK